MIFTAESDILELARTHLDARAASLWPRTQFSWHHKR